MILSIYHFGKRISTLTFATVNKTGGIMKKRLQLIQWAVFVLSAILLWSCERVDDDPDIHIKDPASEYIELQEVVEILTMLPITQSQLDEVHAAVSSSSGNGYDEEYTMSNLFALPGAGVGDEKSRSGQVYEVPMRDLINSAVKRITSAEFKTRSEFADLNVLRTLDRMGPEAFLEALSGSDMQIYWPFSEEWDGAQLPIITYDPEDGSETNMGYRLYIDDDGSRRVEEVVVDEAVAKKSPVWVVNRNDDAGYTSLEMLRREDPDWGEGGGNIIVKPGKTVGHTKSTGDPVRSLILRSFTMKQHYDTWFAGASEFFVKLGSVEDFTAATEAELRLYNPAVTDFMIVVKRNQLGIPQPFNALLISDMSDQLTHCALMITEDDGGTITKWDCQALVRVASKSYGIEISIPINSMDDIVWRGQIATSWFKSNSNIMGHFGDVDMIFEVVES